MELLRWNAAHLTWPDWQRVIPAYWGYCSFVDEQMGRVLEALERCGRRDDTIVVVTAGHGDMFVSHRLFNKGFHMYDETHRVPLLIVVRVRKMPLMQIRPPRFGCWAYCCCAWRAYTRSPLSGPTRPATCTRSLCR